MTTFEKRDGVVIGMFHPFSKISGVRSYFSTRIGGVSPVPFDSLNVGRHTGDDPGRVEENRRRFFHAVQIDSRCLVLQRQVHSDRIGYADVPGMVPDTDACFTDRSGVFLAVTFADCVPILFCEPDRRVAGVIHAGWRGTEKQVSRKTIEAVVGRYDLDPAGIIAVIGPSISAKNYEVSEDVASRFEERLVGRNGSSKPHVDLWEANRDQLVRAGVREIHLSGLCTQERQDLFFSHRASGGSCGRMLGVIGFSGTT